MQNPERPIVVTQERGILTTAFGPKTYLDRAVNLARSCRYHSPEVPLAIITDKPEDKSLRRHFNQVLPLVQTRNHSEGTNLKGLGFEHKFFLDKLSPFKKTIFLDSDCLLFADISAFFERFSGHVFQPSDLWIRSPQWVHGPCKKWLMDLDELCRHYGIRTLLGFNGGCLYFENDSAASEAFFAKVREVVQLCRENNWIRTLTVEPVYAVALKLTKTKPDYSPQIRIMLNATIIPPDQRNKLCTLRSRNRLILHQENISFRVLHFLEISKRQSLYLRETLKLKVWEFFRLATVSAFGVDMLYSLSLPFYRLFKFAKSLGFRFAGSASTQK